MPITLPSSFFRSATRAGATGVLFFLALPCFAQGIPSLPTPASGTTPVFSVVPLAGVTVPVTQRISAGVYGLYSTDPHVEILCTAVPIKLNQLFTLNPIYEYISPPANSNGKKERENQINLALDSGFDWKRFRLDDRNRLGRRFIASAEDSTRYRNLISGAYRLPGRQSITVFHWQEFFYESTARQWNQHHLAAGLEHTFDKHIVGQLYYFRLAAEGRGDIHALGITLILAQDHFLIHK